MALKTFVKISEVNNLSDARYCAGMGVDQLGFSVVPDHPHFVDSEKFNEITGWVAGVKFVGELAGQPADFALDVVQHYKFDLLQTTRVDFLDEFSRLQIPLILDLNVDEYPTRKALEKVLDYSNGLVEYFLVHSTHEEENRHRFEEMVPLAKRFNMVLGSWVNRNNIDELLSTASFGGIALKGGDEIKPGYKDFDELADILEVIEVEERY